MKKLQTEKSHLRYFSFLNFCVGYITLSPELFDSIESDYFDLTTLASKLYI